MASTRTDTICRLIRNYIKHPNDIAKERLATFLTQISPRELIVREETTRRGIFEYMLVECFAEYSSDFEIIIVPLMDLFSTALDEKKGDVADFFVLPFENHETPVSFMAKKGAHNLLDHYLSLLNGFIEKGFNTRKIKSLFKIEQDDIDILKSIISANHFSLLSTYFEFLLKHLNHAFNALRKQVHQITGEFSPGMREILDYLKVYSDFKGLKELIESHTPKQKLTENEVFAKKPPLELKINPKNIREKLNGSRLFSLKFENSTVAEIQPDSPRP